MFAAFGTRGVLGGGVMVKLQPELNVDAGFASPRSEPTKSRLDQEESCTPLFDHPRKGARDLTHMIDIR